MGDEARRRAEQLTAVKRILVGYGIQNQVSDAEIEEHLKMAKTEIGVRLGEDAISRDMCYFHGGGITITSDVNGGGVSNAPTEMQCMSCQSIAMVSEQYSDNCVNCGYASWQAYERPNPVDNSHQLHTDLEKIRIAIEDLETTLEQKKFELQNRKCKHVIVLNEFEFMDEWGMNPQDVRNKLCQLEDYALTELGKSLGIPKSKISRTSIGMQLDRMIVPPDVWVDGRGEHRPLVSLDSQHLHNILNYVAKFDSRPANFAEWMRREPRIYAVVAEAVKRKISIPTEFRSAYKLLQVEQLDEIGEEYLAKKDSLRTTRPEGLREVKELTMTEKLTETTKELGSALKEGAAIGAVGMSIDKAVSAIVEKYGDQAPFLKDKTTQLALKAVIPGLAVYGVDVTGDKFPFPGGGKIRKVGIHGTKAAGYDAAVQAFGVIFEKVGPIFMEMFSTWTKVADQLPDNGDPIDYQAEKEKLEQKEKVQGGD
jgi:hypothetical protein